jgi:predicted unusual protein kinase regulating ubiquinone biosynthesis (AarF/ABC1/UbiB family)
MDDLLQEYLECEKNATDVPRTNDADAVDASDAADAADADAAAAADQQGYDEYVKRTEEYYYKMSCRDLFRALWFTMSSCYIGLSEFIKYKVGWKSRNHAIMDVSRRLAAKNMMYVKIFQAFATNRNIVSHELNEFFSEYTDSVTYSDEEYDINELKELEARSPECRPYGRLRIENDYRPIKSGLMSLIFRARILPPEGSGSGTDGVGDRVVVKYLRKNIRKNFNASMNNLVVFAKLTKYVPYMKTLNVENLILQNIVSLNDQVCFRKELANITTYYNRWKDYETVKIPKPYPDYTETIHPDIIVMEYIDGMKITEIDPADNDTFAKVLAGFNGKAAFCSSIYHGDLHPGNILFIKASSEPTHRIGILDFGIIGYLTRSDQEILFKALKYTYQRRYNKIIDLIMTCELSEEAARKTKTDNGKISGYGGQATLVKATLGPEKFNQLRDELMRVLINYTTPQVKFFGVAEIYEINYILNNYGMMFRRSLYRLFITVAIMDSIGTRLGSEMSYVQHMTDIIMDMYNIKQTDEDTDEDAGRGRGRGRGRGHRVVLK